MQDYEKWLKREEENIDSLSVNKYCGVFNVETYEF